MSKNIGYLRELWLETGGKNGISGKMDEKGDETELVLFGIEATQE